MKSIIIDTNGFLRALLNDIPEQAEKVRELIRQAKKGQITIIVPQIVLFEIDFALEKYYKQDKQEVIEKLKSLLSASYLQIESREVFHTALVFYEKNAISFVDCFLLARAELEGIELFTFDKKLKSLAV